MKQERDKAAARKARLTLMRHMGGHTRVARKEAQLTQADVAERLGVATEVYGRLERGGLLPRLSTFRRLCRFLDADANVLLGLKASAPVRGLDTSGRPPEEPPAVRRLLRLVHRMNDKQLAALTRVALVLVDPGTLTSSDTPDSPTP